MFVSGPVKTCGRLRFLSFCMSFFVCLLSIDMIQRVALGAKSKMGVILPACSFPLCLFLR